VSLLQLVVLTIVQGITEFLPISSSGHLLLVPVVTGWPDRGVNLDAAVHIGTLAAVMVYFWRDVWRMAASPLPARGPDRRAARRPVLLLAIGTISALVAVALLHGFAPDLFRSARVAAITTLGFGTLAAVLAYFWRDVWRMAASPLPARGPDRRAARRLVLLLAIGTVPALVAGALLHGFAPDFFRSAKLVAWTTLGYGLLLFLVDRYAPRIRHIEHLSVGGALFIGVAQMLALVPGTSRSGATMTAGRLLGLERPEAARFAMLLSIPVTAAAGGLALKDILENPTAVSAGETGLAIGLTFLTALLAIWFLMSVLRRFSFAPFAAYRLLLGLALLVWLYGYA
jgi:undecaprenyl-diphosphatase